MTLTRNGIVKLCRRCGHLAALLVLSLVLLPTVVLAFDHGPYVPDVRKDARCQGAVSSENEAERHAAGMNQQPRRRVPAERRS